MESMTGYAFIEKSTSQFSFSVEIKSLNSRYFETYVNLPRILRNEENKLNDMLKENFIRGKIELNIDIFDWAVRKPVMLDTDVIKKYYTELNKVHKELKIEEPLKFESVLQLEGIITKSHAALLEKSFDEIIKTVNAVTKKAVKMRIAEGNATGRDLLNSISDISGYISRVKSISKKLVKEKVSLLKERLSRISENSIDDNRIYSEVAIIADKLDINEEIVRSMDHIKKFKTTMKSSGQIGRKLDFIAQEIFREINTIASKSNKSEVSHLIVDAKNHVDKIREHCRNIV